jgi:predicted O-methyltransferase YrrM
MKLQWFREVERSGLGWRTSKEATYDIARIVIERDIVGDFVECGVYAGASAALMARALMDARDLNRVVHLFDSFEGLPEPGPDDLGMVAGGASCSLETVQSNMMAWGIPGDLLCYHPGWFKDTVPAFKGKISMLRLDGDLKESTKICLEYLLPKVSLGGWVIVDDYDLPGCRAAFDGIIAPAPIYFRVHE